MNQNKFETYYFKESKESQQNISIIAAYIHEVYNSRMNKTLNNMAKNKEVKQFINDNFDLNLIRRDAPSYNEMKQKANLLYSYMYGDILFIGRYSEIKTNEFKIVSAYDEQYKSKQIIKTTIGDNWEFDIDKDTKNIISKLKKITDKSFHNFLDFLAESPVKGYNDKLKSIKFSLLDYKEGDKKGGHWDSHYKEIAFVFTFSKFIEIITSIIRNNPINIDIFNLNTLVHELQHAYDYWISDGKYKISSKDVEKTHDTGSLHYFRAQWEINARFTDFLNRIIKNPNNIFQSLEELINEMKDRFDFWDKITPKQQKTLIRRISSYHEYFIKDIEETKNCFDDFNKIDLDYMRCEVTGYISKNRNRNPIYGDIYIYIGAIDKDGNIRSYHQNEIQGYLDKIKELSEKYMIPLVYERSSSFTNKQFIAIANNLGFKDTINNKYYCGAGAGKLTNKNLYRWWIPKSLKNFNNSKVDNK